MLKSNRTFYSLTPTCGNGKFKLQHIKVSDTLSNSRTQVASEHYLTLQKDVLSRTLELISFPCGVRDSTRRGNVGLRSWPV